MGHQLLGAVLRLAQTGFLEGDVHIVIDMGVVGRKVPPGNAKRGVAPANGKMHQCYHDFASCAKNKKESTSEEPDIRLPKGFFSS